VTVSEFVHAAETRDRLPLHSLPHPAIMVPILIVTANAWGECIVGPAH
jgi:hypothetical protein